MRPVAIQSFVDRAAAAATEDGQQLVTLSKNASGSGAVIRTRLPRLGRRRAGQRFDIAIVVNGIDERIASLRRRWLFPIGHELAPTRSGRIGSGSGLRFLLRRSKIFLVLGLIDDAEDEMRDITFQ